MNGKGLAIVLIVGVVVGLLGGYFLMTVPQLDQLNKELADKEDRINELNAENQGLISQVSELESSLDEASEDITNLEADLTQALGHIATVDLQLQSANSRLGQLDSIANQLELDLVFLRMHRLERETEKASFQAEIDDWLELKEASYAVSTDLPDLIDNVISQLENIDGWENNPPPEGQPIIVYMTWWQGFHIIMNNYMHHYYIFETTYLEAIEGHIEIATNI